MASYLSNPLCLQPPPNSLQSPPPIPLPQSLHLPSHHYTFKSHTTHHFHFQHKPTHVSRRILCFSQTPLSSSSSSSQFTPPSSREEAILQAKTCLCSTLQKPLNNPIVLPRQKLKRQRQPRLRVEIPVVDDSPNSLSQLAFEVFSDLPITRKGARPCVLILWANLVLVESAHQVFVVSSSGSSNPIVNADLGSVNVGDMNSADLVVFMSPESSELDQVRGVCDDVYPKPVVLFNPKWAFEDESGFGKELRSFAGSFGVVFSFLGLEVKGILSRRKGVVFRYVQDGILSGEEWLVFVEDEKNNGVLKVVSRFKKRPAIGDVESVLYNLMAANSPVTKSVKFIRDLASNVTGKKPKQ